MLTVINYYYHYYILTCGFIVRSINKTICNFFEEFDFQLITTTVYYELLLINTNL